MAYVYAGRYGSEALIDAEGNAQAFLTVTVLQPTGAAATLYTDRTKAASPGTNQVATDSRGNLAFYADPGLYDLVSAEGTVRVEVPADPAETNHGGLADPHGDRAYADSQRTEEAIYLSDYVAADLRSVADAAIASGTATLTSATAAFTAADVGKLVSVAAAGTGGSTGLKLGATINALLSATQVTLSTTATTTVTGVAASIFTDDTANVQAAINAAIAAKKELVCAVPTTYVFMGRVTIVGRLRMRAVGPQRTTFYAKIGTTGQLFDASQASNLSKALDIGGFTIDLNDARTIQGLKVHNVDGSYLHDIEVRYGSDGIFLGNCDSTTVERIWGLNQTNAAIRIQDAGFPNLQLRDIYVGCPQVGVTMAHGILIQDILAGVTLDNVQVLGPLSGGGTISAGISVLNPGGNTGLQGQFIFANNCQTDWITGPGLNLQNVRGLWATNNFWGTKPSISTPGVLIDGGTDHQYTNSWISGTGVEFRNAPDQTHFDGIVFPQTSAGGAFVMPASNPPTRLTFDHVYPFSTLSNDIVALAGAAPSATAQAVNGGGRALTDTGGTQPSVALFNASTGKYKRLRVDRTAAGNLNFYSDANDTIAQLSDDGNLTLRKASASKQRTLALNASALLSIMADDGTTTTLSVADNGDLTVKGALDHDGASVGFYGTAPAAKPTVTGSRGGNAALQSLLTALAALGLLTDSSS